MTPDLIMLPARGEGYVVMIGLVLAGLILYSVWCFLRFVWAGLRRLVLGDAADPWPVATTVPSVTRMAQTYGALAELERSARTEKPIEEARFVDEGYADDLPFAPNLTRMAQARDGKSVAEELERVSDDEWDGGLM